MTLAQIQRLFWEAARKQGSPEALQDCFAGDLRLSGPQRMGIYASAFFVRQLAALSTFLPKTERLLQDDFRRLGREYILKVPGTDAAIESFPARFADFLEAFPTYRDVAALARLELARNRALLAPEDSPILSLEDFQKLTPATRLRAARHAVVVSTTWGAVELFDEGVKRLDEAKDDMQAGNLVTLFFFRKEFAVHHRVVARDEAQLLELGNLDAQRYSPLEQINADNVGSLEVAWRWNAANYGPRPETLNVTTPLMVNVPWPAWATRAGQT